VTGPATDPASHREILAIALPMIASNVAVPLLGMVDTAVVGHLDSPRYLGAVAVGATVFSFLYSGTNFLRMGTTGLVAQASGARDAGAVRTALLQGLAVAFALGIAMVALQGAIAAFAFELLTPDADVVSSAREYFHIRIWSAPATLGLMVATGALIGLGHARGALAAVVAQNLVNAALCLLFVPGFGWGVRGVAAATLVADYVGLAVALAIVAPHVRGVAGSRDLRAVLAPRALRGLLRLNAHLLVRTLVLVGVFAFVTAIGARQGQVVLAANALLLQLIYLLAFALDGFANAAEVLVGRAVGARDDATLAIAIRRGLQWTGGVALAFVAMFALGGPALFALLTSLDEVRRAAMDYLPWLVAAPLACAWGYLWDGVFVGATMSRQMRDTMIVSAVVFAVAWWALRPLGNHGLWAAFLLFSLMRGAAQWWVWRRRAAVAA
jgi:MATE family multidrug resistance protein